MGRRSRPRLSSGLSQADLGIGKMLRCCAYRIARLLRVRALSVPAPNTGARVRSSGEAVTAKARLLSLRSAFWCGVVAVLYLALKAQPEQEMLRGWDKTNHLLAFAALGVLGAYSWPDRLLRLFTGLAAYGALIEVLQWFTPDRQADGWGHPGQSARPADLLVSTPDAKKFAAATMRTTPAPGRERTSCGPQRKSPDAAIDRLCVAGGEGL